MSQNRTMTKSQETTKKRSNSKRRGNRDSKANSVRYSSKDVANDRSDYQKKVAEQGFSNDPNWYVTSTELAEQVAQLSFQQILGQGYGIGSYKIPTVMAMYMNPSPGNTYKAGLNPAATGGYTTSAVLNSKDGVNLAAQKLYTRITSMTGRATTAYQPQDIAIMLLAIGEVASISEHIRRAFGVAMTYNPRNRFMPTGLLKAMNIMPQDLFDNVARYRMEYNVEMTRINQIPLLDNIGYIRKCRDMYQHVYQDSPSAMAQCYVPVPYSTWILDETSSPNGSILKTKYCTTDFLGADQKTSGIKTMGQWISLLSSMITALLTSTSLNVVYADIMNAANKYKLPMWQFDYLTETYAVYPEYSVTALLQIHNTDIVGAPCGVDHTETSGSTSVHYTEKNDVLQDPNLNCIIYNPALMGPRAFSSAQTARKQPFGSTIVDFPTDNPSVGDKIDAMRYSSILSGYFRPISDPRDTAKFAQENLFVILTDHYCVGGLVFTNNDTADGVLPNDVTWIDTNIIAGGATNPVGLPAVEKFAYHMLGYTGLSTSANQFTEINGELEFWTTVDYEYLDRVNRFLLMGLFEFRM